MTERASAARTGTARSGNNTASRGVMLSDHFDLEDPTTANSGPNTVSGAATVASPVSMAHLEQFTDAEWVEPTDELSGTAVFDATGDKAAMPSWDELVRQHADRVYRLAYRLSGNQHDAEDLTQETFIRVFRSVQNYQPGTFEGWLHRITTNLFLDMVRRRGRIRMEALPEDYDRVPADEPNPEQIYHDSRLGADLQAALDSLAPEFRAAVVLCDIEGLSYEEIGATLGVKLGTVRSRIHRGRQALRDYLARHSGASTLADARDMAESA
ncbi:RNA polymerase sigma factor SigE [Mycolicibacterium aurum]|uniref:RNA polymerase sigma factor SigE n=1 Tax=Mycolicibacterium aurum TaxID=1791 RepID=A0A448IY26_MYCAU|nr:RNA polymerase sigma factor SigE [Mycolicibacterium aurum]VEG57217.1 RNA polymerase sigma factor SigE [Mycolicibacterium aurum]